jgi:AAA domain/CHC2 zinc finger
MSDISKAKRVLPLPDLMARLGFGDHAKKSAKCPFHDDGRNSFSVWQTNGVGGWHWKCHAGCGDGDEINFLELAEGLSPSDAVTRFLEIAGVDGSKPHFPASERATFDWRACVDAFTDNEVERLADWRGLSGEFCSWLHKQGLVGLCKGCIAFPVHNQRGAIVAAHARGPNGNWFYEPRGTNARAFVVGELIEGRPIHIFESQWDAFAFMDVLEERTGVIVSRGSTNGALVKHYISGWRSPCYLWTQNDQVGDKWQREISAIANATVKRVQIPLRHKDLNDWTQAGATVVELRSALASAVIIKEEERSWPDALNEAIVTSRELHNLKIESRRKLLGDWFCEGDLGFIFAFRGVGKTWFALGIASALSAGNKWGPWQAHEKVRVFYLDGEMPPDLMRDRCEGLNCTDADLEFLNHEILFEWTNKVLNITRPEVQQAITDRCLAVGVKVLILDNLSTLASGMKENDADSWELVNNWLLELRRRKIAVIIVHHAGRSGEMRGTTKREDNVFWTIALDDCKKNADDKRGARFVSRFTKPSRNTQDETPAYEWHLVTGNTTGEVSVSYKETRSLEVFRQLIEEGVTECTQLAEEMKVSRGTVSKYAKKATDEGWLEKKGRSYKLKNSES